MAIATGVYRVPRRRYVGSTGRGLVGPPVIS
jgi:hypothetical protein